jgi:hypothetical protein
MSKNFTATKVSDLVANFPELSRSDKFKKVIDSAFKAGFSLEIQLSGPTTGFKSASGKVMNCRISRNGKAFLIKPMYFTHTSVTLQTYESQKDRFLSFDPSVTDGSVNGVPTHPGSMVQTQVTSWAQLAQTFGNLIKDDMKLVSTHTCIKCGGSGKINRFSHIANGTCFQCMGVGKWIEPTGVHKQGSKIDDNNN